MKIVLKFVVFITIGFVKVCYSKVALNIRVYNYENENDIKHDGYKCETFHWANDNCDPMFNICVTSKNKCDVLKHSIDHWRNKKFISTVLQKTVKLDTIQRSFAIEVRVDDHDKLDGHDHVAVFKSNFEITNMNQNYAKAMTVSPSGLSVVLFASIIMQCDQNYFGKDCDTYCQPQEFNYECNRVTGERICLVDCGPYGVCDWNSNRFTCKCRDGWKGDQCLFSDFESCSKFTCDLNCTFYKIYKYCTCKSIPNSKRCQETLEITRTTVQSSTVRSTVRKITKSNVKNNATLLSTSTEDDRRSEVSTMFKKDASRPEPIHQSQYSPTTIAIICILIILCIFILALLIVIRSWRKKDKINNNGFFRHAFRSHLPLPPVIYYPNICTNKTPGSVFTEPIILESQESHYDLCTVQSDCRSEVPLIAFDEDNYRDDDDAYEKPRCDKVNSNTIESDLGDSDTDSVQYEVPRKFV